jgi:hypothetical protein
MLLVASSFLLLCVPAAILLTFLLLPLWSWIEATFAIESVGHSGPADWCFWTVYAFLALGLLFLWAAYRRRSRRRALVERGYRSRMK